MSRLMTELWTHMYAIGITCHRKLGCRNVGLCLMENWDFKEESDDL